jgi:site-specific recombinase XerC
VRSYAGQLKWLVGFAHARGQTRLSDLTPGLLRAALLEKQNPKNRALNWLGGEAGAKALASATRHMARWLTLQGLPVADLTIVKAPRAPERIQPRLTQEEFATIEAAILNRLVQPDRRIPRLQIARDLALIYMLADTGLRASEVCAMDIRHVDFAQGAILVLRGKGKKERALNLRDSDETSGNVTLKLLADWIDMRQGVRGAVRTTRLWVSMKGNPLTRDELRKILGRICEAAGVDGNRPPHTFRRSWFTESYLASPSSIRVLASRMGWSDKSHHMIDVYTRGAEVELARTTPVPSLSARWHAAAPAAPLRPTPTRAPALPAPRARPAKRQPAASAEALQVLLEAITSDPALRRVLLQALRGVA